MFSNAERERLQARIAELENENAAIKAERDELKDKLNTVELRLYKEVFSKLVISVKGGF